ncbi:MAG: HEPN domain-containing protein [Actinobacteria bacterium]|nr:HEPN domain-containing protein [Actinomycetota bacterium]
MKEETSNWLESASYDLETARHMLDAGRYIYTVFMCHLSIEKSLKAAVVENTGTTPPRTHNLGTLLGLSGLSIGADEEEFLLELSNLSVATRYPEDFHRAMEDFSKERAEAVYLRSERIVGWIGSCLRK